MAKTARIVFQIVIEFAPRFLPQKFPKKIWDVKIWICADASAPFYYCCKATVSLPYYASSPLSAWTVSLIAIAFMLLRYTATRHWHILMYANLIILFLNALYQNFIVS